MWQSPSICCCESSKAAFICQRKQQHRVDCFTHVLAICSFASTLFSPSVIVSVIAGGLATCFMLNYVESQSCRPCFGLALFSIGRLDTIALCRSAGRSGCDVVQRVDCVSCVSASANRRYHSWPCVSSAELISRAPSISLTSFPFCSGASYVTRLLTIWITALIGAFCLVVVALVKVKPLGSGERCDTRRC